MKFGMLMQNPSAVQTYRILKLKMVKVRHRTQIVEQMLKSQISKNSKWQLAAISKALNYYFN